jgi:type VI secretion system protein VasG
VAIGLTTVPPAVEDCRRRIDGLEVALGIAKRENLTGANNQERIDELTQAKSAAETELAALDIRWKEESELVTKIRKIREQLESGLREPAAADPSSKESQPKPAATEKKAETAATPAAPEQNPGTGTSRLAEISPEERTQLRAELADLTAKLKTLQGETPLMQVCVDSQAIAEVVSGWTGIPVGRMVTDEIRTVLALKERMEERIVGQSHA